MALKIGTFVRIGSRLMARLASDQREWLSPKAIRADAKEYNKS
jgi:hypothetical protein